MGKQPPKIVCPAGRYSEADGEIGVVCGVEDRFFKVKDNPRTVIGRCSTSEYTKCPAWIADKEQDPAVAAALGTPKMVNCPICLGTGITREEAKSPQGILFVSEKPCDDCAGTGREEYIAPSVATAT